MPLRCRYLSSASSSVHFFRLRHIFYMALRMSGSLKTDCSISSHGIDLIGSALCLQGVEPFYVRRLKPTHGLKSSSWTCCGLILSFGLTTLNLVSCVLGFFDESAGAVTSDGTISFRCWFCIISTTS